jgi:glutathione S-transferase
VQRAVVLLNEKTVDFTVTYIDLKNKPDWFLRLSPLGKVPVLKVEDAVLFESLVICEYLDETNPPSLHPADPLRRAVNRAWGEFSGELLVDLYRLSLAPEAGEMETHRQAAREKLERLQGVLSGGPFFNGPDFALVDAAFAPAFLRIALLHELHPLDLLDGLAGVQRWSAALLARKSVQESVVPEFAELFRKYLAQNGGHIGRVPKITPFV